MVSVIVPAYNVVEYLPRCLDSILGQTYNNIEIIVVDDGSTDGTSQVLDEYAKKYPQIVKAIHIRNGGVTNARLTGVRFATGIWIGFVDGDDKIDSNMYEVLVHNAIEYEADISHCGYQMNFADGRVHYFYNTGDFVEQDNTTALKELLLGVRIEPGLCNKLFHKKLFDSLLESELMDTTIKINEDLLMNYYLFNSSCKAVYDDRCFYHYMVRATSASRQRISKYKIYDPIKVKKIIFSHCDTKLKLVAETALLNTCIYSYCGIITQGEEFRNDKKKIREELLHHISCKRYLPRRTRILAQGIYRMPWVIDIMYPIYMRYFQRRVYE